jgi:hypothetical protein
MYKPCHLIGLELGISVASAALRREPTGAPGAWRGDVVATAKRNLKAGETLDGEGGYTVYGKLMPAADSLRAGRPADRPGAQGQRYAFVSMQHRAVLDVGSGADLDAVVVGTQHGVPPDACFVTEMYVADDRGVGGNPGVASQYGSAIAECVGGHADSLSV